MREFNDETEEGMVFDQDPESGERIERGNIVTIQVSQGKRKVDVPDVKGLSVAEAVARLKDAGPGGEPRRGLLDRSREGTVIAQDPAAGKRVVEDTRVRINVSQGAKPIAVPNVVGRSYDDAKAALEEDGFVVRRVDQNSNIAPNTVIETRPPAGSELQRGGDRDRGRLQGPAGRRGARTSRGSTRRARALELEGAGFSVSVSDEPTDDPAERRLRARAGSGRRRPGRAGLDGRDLRRPLLGRAGVSRKPRVAVILGGRSSEHEISRASAASVLEALEGAGYETVAGRDRARRAVGPGSK